MNCFSAFVASVEGLPDSSGMTWPRPCSVRKVVKFFSHVVNSEESVMWFNVVVATMAPELAGPSEANDSLAVFSVELVGVDIPGGGKTGPAGGAVCWYQVGG